MPNGKITDTVRIQSYAGKFGGEFQVKYNDVYNTPLFLRLTDELGVADIQLDKEQGEELRDHLLTLFPNE